AAEEALRRWLNAAALVRPGGPVVVLAEATLPAVQALIRWDPVTFSERELAERAELGFPPAVRMASVTGPSEAVADFVGALSSSGDGLPARAEVLGPIPLERAGGDRPPEASRALIRIGRRDGLELPRLVKAPTETMLDAPGAGLAAPQIGVGLRVFTYHVDDHEPGHLINPSLDLSKEEDEDDEGCLSFPGLAYPVKRAWGVVA